MVATSRTPTHNPHAFTAVPSQVKSHCVGGGVAGAAVTTHVTKNTTDHTSASGRGM